MFMGVHQFRHAGRVSSYSEAQQVLEKYRHTPKRKLLRERKAYGYHLGMNRNHGVTWVRDESGGSIVFRLYDTDVVTWNPDNSVTVENWGSVTTSDFAHQFLPQGIGLRHKTRNGGDNGITYCNGVSREVATSWGSFTVHERDICFGSAVTFEQQDEDMWLPREDTCEVFTLPGPVDQQGARELSKRYHLRDFELWLSVGPMHLDLTHAHWDRDTCLAALEARDFRTAAVYLPLVAVPQGFGLTERMKPLPIATSHWRLRITMTSLAKLKLAAWAHEGLIPTMTFRTAPMAVYERCKQREQALESVDAGW